ncbi:MAG: uroporphyrinogen-III synthase [Campylobacter sp.]|nr:uroporphyrinogen-III synthase [Campylobacter sp.]
MDIYLLNSTPFEGVKNLILNEIVFYDFSVNLAEFNALIITSKNALKALKQSKNPLNFDLQIYAVGENTAKEALNLGFKKVKFPKKSYAKELFEEFKEELKELKCLYLRAKKIASTLDKDLLHFGVDLTQKIVYENIYKESKNPLNHPCIIIFSSPLSVENFLKNYEIKDEDKLVALGKSTAKKLKDYKNLFICEKQDLKESVKLAKSLI